MQVMLGLEEQHGQISDERDALQMQLEQLRGSTQEELQAAAEQDAATTSRILADLVTAAQVHSCLAEQSRN